jgi:hypothetical protein
MNRVDGSVSASDSHKKSAAILLASLFDHTHQTTTVLTLMRRERLTNPESIMERVRETLQIVSS